MRTKEIRGDPNICPSCGSDRVGCSDSIDTDETVCIKEIKLGFFCIDCGDTFDAIFISTGRIVVEG